MKLEWMGEYREVIEQLIKYCNIYAAVYHRELPHGTDTQFSFAQIQVVEYLLENEDLNQNMHAIASRLGITDSTFSKLVSRLVKKNMLQKFHVEGNRKNIIIRVTEEGKRVYADYVRYIVKHHFGPMFQAGSTIPREALPDVAAMLGAGLPGTIAQPAGAGQKLIPLRPRQKKARTPEYPPADKP